jgi:hypothetical protein
MTNIENRIDLRLRCVELALDFYKDLKMYGSQDVMDVAKKFELFILGDSELPEYPMSMDRVLYETMLKIMNDNDYNGKELEKIKETLANSKQE